MNANVQRPPVRVALVGLGRSMFSSHYSVYRDHPALFDVTCACDLVKERRDRVERDFPACSLFRNVADMLEERDIDLVDIATPSTEHVKHALLSLKKDFWTLLETPMALSLDDVRLLKGADVRARNRLIVFQRGLFDADFLLARQAMKDSRLGRIYEIRVSRGEYVRRDEWQGLQRFGGGVVNYAMSNLVPLALQLLPSAPIQMWSDLKRLASLGDAEDYAHLSLKTREGVTAEVTYSSTVLPQEREPAFVIRGDRGTFRVAAGAETGTLTMIDPAFSFPRRRTSVSVPPLDGEREDFPVVTETVALPSNTPTGPAAFWRAVYQSVRTGVPPPLSLEASIEAVRFGLLMKKASPF